MTDQSLSDFEKFIRTQGDNFGYRSTMLLQGGSRFQPGNLVYCKLFPDIEHWFITASAYDPIRIRCYYLIRAIKDDNGNWISKREKCYESDLTLISH